MGNRSVRIKDEVSVPGRIVKSETVTLKAFERFIYADGALADTPAAFTITLPPAPECADKIFTIFSPTGGSYNVTITSADGQFDTFTVLNADQEGIALFCNGAEWYEIGTQT